MNGLQQQDNVNRNIKTIYDPEDVEKMLIFKKDYEIVNDKQLVRYMQEWNPKIQKKSDLTPKLVKPFLKWVESVNE